MAFRERGLLLLGEVERSLVRLAAEAGESRSYAEASALMDVARRIQLIGEEGFGGAVPTAALSRVNSGTGGADAVRSDPAVSVRRASAGEYPRFLRDGDSLVKVGWSKSDRSEYEHKCPKHVVNLLVKKCAGISGPGKRFVMDGLLPLRDPSGGGELPGYQAYVALAFLRHAGLAVQHGRSGYSIPKYKTIVADAESAWIGLKAR